jgi:hypothetical protein
MLNRFARALFTRLLTPLARLLLGWGVSPDVVTAIGTLGVCVGALAFYPRGELLVGTLFITAFVFSDLVDGTMARLSGRSTPWGAFLDSTLDRIGDARSSAGWCCGSPATGTSRSSPPWRSTAWRAARSCRTPAPRPRASGCARTSASRSAPTGWS